MATRFLRLISQVMMSLLRGQLKETWGGCCLDQGVLGLGVDEVLLEVGAGEDQKVILERIKHEIISSQFALAIM